MKLAAIDIGSNSIHLVVVRAVKGQHPEIIDREKEMVRLGAGSLREHLLSKEKIDRALTTLRRYKQMAEANRVDLIITTATSAVRESHNAYAFIEAVRKDVGLDVQLLPGVEEARLIALAVSEVTDFDNRRALIIDIGGGSTEFIIGRGMTPERHRHRVDTRRLEAIVGADHVAGRHDLAIDEGDEKVRDHADWPSPHARRTLAIVGEPFK